MYVSNPYLYEEICKSKELDELTPNAVKMLDLMIKNIIKKKRYNDPSIADDIAQTAWVDIIMYWRNFDEHKYKNAFAYYSSMIMMGMAKGWNKLYPKGLKPSDTISLDSNIHSI